MPTTLAPVPIKLKRKHRERKIQKRTMYRTRSNSSSGAKRTRHKQAPRLPRCENGHEMVAVRIATIKGARMAWVCPSH